MCRSLSFIHFEIAYLILLLIGSSSSFNCTDVQLNANPNPTELLAYLTHPCVYDKYTSPLHSLFKHQPDVIHVRMHIYYIKHKPAQDLEFQTQFLIQLRWKDERLAYADMATNITRIAGEKDLLHHIWSPYIYLANERAALIRGKQTKDVSLHILPDGTVLYDSRSITSVICRVKLGRFPLDKQKCYFNIDTWKFTSNDLLLKWENETAISIGQETSFLAEYQLISAMHLTDYNFTEPDSINAHLFNCSSLRVVFLVSRRYGFHIMNYYVPSMLIVGISWVTFWESPDATPGRCLLGTGTMLTFIVLGIEVSKSLPIGSSIRSNDIWFIVCTAFIFCSLAEFAFVNTLWRYGGEVELKKRTSKYILKSSLAQKPNLKPRRRSLSCPGSPTGRWENPLKRVVNNELTVKSLSDLEISLPLSDLKTLRRETFEISETSLEAPATTMTWQEIAVWIDKKSRFVFPICFLIFNIIYWGLLCIS